jgi:ABC-type nitrate/sulfonate/bicarbonate transport system substrate-binding protein
MAMSGDTMLDRLVWGVPSFWIERLPLYYGRHRGIFQDRGIDLHIKYYWGGRELAHGARHSEVTIGELGLPPFLAAAGDGLRARIIGSSVIQKMNHHLVARTGIEHLKDLAGMRIGILALGSCDDFFLRCMLDPVGLNLQRDVELVALGKSYSDLSRYSSGAVAAGFVPEPYIALGESRGLFRILASVKTYFPRYQWGIILAHDDVLKENADLVGRAMAAFRESCKAIKQDPEAAARFGAQVFQMPKDIFSRALYRDLDDWEVDARLDLEGLEVGLQVQKELGAAPQQFELRGFVRQL